MSEPFDRALRAAARRNRSAGVCPDAAMLAAYADNALSAGERHQVETHSADCAACQQHLALLGAISLERGAPPEPSRSWLARWGWLVPVATAVMVVAVWTRMPQQRLAEPIPASPPADSAAVAPGQKSKQTPFESIGPVSKGDDTAQLAAKVARPATASPARPAESRDTLERRDEEKQNVAADPDPLRRAIGGRAVGQAAAASTAPTPPAPAAPAAAPPAALADAVKEEALGAEVSRRRQAAAPMAKAASTPLVVSASAVESYRLVGNRLELSQDGGATWRAITAPRPGGFTAAACVDGGPCWFGGADGVVLRRALGEFSFSSLPVRDHVVAIAPDGPLTAVATVVGGRRFRTADGGVTWTPIP